jgi:general secretion pathway protein L
MSVSRLLFLGGNRPWLEILDAAIARRGEGYDPAEWREGETLIAVAPAADVTLHWLDLPDLSPAQANAAARLQLADRVLGDAHIACGLPDELGTRPVAVVSAEKMRRWIAELDPDAIVPAQMIVAAPAEGAVRAVLGPETILRGQCVGMVDDPELTPMLVEGEIPTLDREAIEFSVLAAMTAPPLDLRQGVFARKTSWLPDWARLRPLAWMAAALLLVTLAIPLAKIARLSLDASALNSQTAEVARAAVGEAVAGEEAAGLLRDRLSAMRGAGGGFSQTASATIAGIAATPNVELTSMGFASDGILRLTARAATQAELDALAIRLRSAGLTVTPGVPTMEQGRPRMDLQVQGR